MQHSFTTLQSMYSHNPVKYLVHIFSQCICACSRPLNLVTCDVVIAFCELVIYICTRKCYCHIICWSYFSCSFCFVEWEASMWRYCSVIIHCLIAIVTEKDTCPVSVNIHYRPDLFSRKSGPRQKVAVVTPSCPFPNERCQANEMMNA